MRWVGTLGLAMLAVLTFAASTLAQDGGCELEVNRTENRFFASGSGFETGETVEIQLFFDGEAVFPTPTIRTADDEGFAGELFIMEPGDPHGTYTVTAVAESCDAEAEFAFLPDTATDSPATPEPRAFDLLLVLTAGFATFIYLATRSARSALRRG